VGGIAPTLSVPYEREALGGKVPGGERKDHRQRNLGSARKAPSHWKSATEGGLVEGGRGGIFQQLINPSQSAIQKECFNLLGGEGSSNSTSKLKIGREGGEKATLGEN